MRYHLLYDNKVTGETKSYTVNSMPLSLAEKYKAIFIKRYVDKPYPNGQGSYPFDNVRLVPA